MGGSSKLGRTLIPEDNRLARKVDYLRISITDRCNLRCFYCQPRGIPLFRHSDILTYEEILFLAKAAAKAGIHKIRLTGGEPLVRRGITDLIKDLVALDGIEEVTLTTNGVLLDEQAASLFSAGLRRINVSLDTLRPLKFHKITGQNMFHQVKRGLALALDLGFDPIKVNMVVIRGVNDDELELFARWAMESPYIVRFIEYMPIGKRTDWHRSKFVSINEIHSRLRRMGTLVRQIPLRSNGPAQDYCLNGSGKIGLIGAISHSFCQTCNRLRLTAEGMLKPCLLSDLEIDVKGKLRSNCSEGDLIRLLHQTVLIKLENTATLEIRPKSCHRGMSQIGG